MIHLLLLMGFWQAQISPAHATSFYIQPFHEFIRSAPIIVAGRVSQIHVEYSITSDGSRAIYTYANFAVKELIKGDLVSKDSLVLRYAGGTKDGTTLEVPGHPEFTENEDAVLFLSEEKEDGAHELVAMELGLFQVKQKNGEDVLSGGLFNYRAATPEAKIENQKVWSIEDLRQAVHDESATPLQKAMPSENSEQNLSPAPDLKNRAVKNEAQVLSDSQLKGLPQKTHESGESPSIIPFLAIPLVFAAGAAVFLRRRKK